MRPIIEQFRDAIAAAGLIPPQNIETDGNLHRFSSNGKQGDKAGWYRYFDGDMPGGIFGCFRLDISESWRADVGRKLTPAEESELRSRIDADRRERAESEAKERAEAAVKAKAIWDGAAPAPDNHPYLARKGVQPHGIRVREDELIIPLRMGSEIHSLQRIFPNGEKRFLEGGRIAGCYFSIGKLDGAADPICIGEGFATSASVHEAIGYPAVAAFNAGNVLAVAMTLRQLFPDRKLIICADDDYQTVGNSGMTKATEAARAVGAILAVPKFVEPRPGSATDFNDMAVLYGLDVVRRTISDAIESACETEPPPPAETQSDPDWPKPQELVAKIEAKPYPLDALPHSVRAAIMEVAGLPRRQSRSSRHPPWPPFPWPSSRMPISSGLTG